MLLAADAHTQGYSKFYYTYLSYEFEFPESYITQKFYAHSPYDDGTIIVQRVENGSGDDPIQITLVDYNGNVQKAFHVFHDDDGSYTPTCAAYNATTGQYCIAGINEESGVAGSPTMSWFLFLDDDLNFLDAQRIGVDLSSVTGSTYKNLFVTDITSVEGSSAFGNGDFVYVGMAGNSLDPTPGVGTEKEMYLGYISYSSPSISFGLTRAVETSGAGINWNFNNNIFPSRIIEAPLNPTDGGFVIAGTAEGGAIFFSRLDYNLADNGTLDVYTPNNINAVGNIYAGDLYFDPIEEEVWFAGSAFGGDYTLSIYQKIIDLNNTGILLYSDATVGSAVPSADWFVRMGWVDDPYFLKIAKIMPTNDVRVAAIAANMYESPYYTSPNTYTYPSVHKIPYDNASLFGFTSLSTPWIDYYAYPRLAGNTGLTNYLSYLEYNNLYYPAHTAHHFPLNVFTNESYVLGQTTYDPTNSSLPERIALNRTDYYFENECNLAEEQFTPGNFQTTISTYTPATSSDVIVGPDVLNYNTTISVVANDCIADLAFKNTASSSQSKNTAILSPSTLTIRSDIQSASFILYNGVGERIMEGRLKTGYVERNFSNYADGLYFLELRDSTNNRIEIIRLIHN